MGDTIINVTEQEEHQKKVKRGSVSGERRRILNRNYYLRNAVEISRRRRIRRSKEPQPVFEYVDGKVIEFYTVQYLAWRMGVAARNIHDMQREGILFKTKFRGKNKCGAEIYLYTKDMRDIIVACFDAARAVCGKKKYKKKFKELLRKKWIEAEINQLW